MATRSSLKLLKLQTIQNYLQCSSRGCASATYVLKRKVKLNFQPTPISKYAIGPFLKEIPHYKEPRPVGDFIFIEVNQAKPTEPKLKVILLKTVDELGIAGDIVDVDRDFARFDLLSSQSAVYHNEYNLKKYRDLIESGGDRSGPSSAYVNATIKQLTHDLILVVMNDKNPWTIEPKHMKVAFRAAGYSVDESCIQLPPEPISGPNIEELQGREFVVTLTINNREKVDVRCMLHHKGLVLKPDWKVDPNKSTEEF